MVCKPTKSVQEVVEQVVMCETMPLGKQEKVGVMYIYD